MKKQLVHICECEEAEKKMDKLVEALKEWAGDTKGKDLKCKVKNSLKGKPVIKSQKPIKYDLIVIWLSTAINMCQKKIIIC